MFIKISIFKAKIYVLQNQFSMLRRYYPLLSEISAISLHLNVPPIHLLCENTQFSVFSVKMFVTQKEIVFIFFAMTLFLMVYIYLQICDVIIGRYVFRVFSKYFTIHVLMACIYICRYVIPFKRIRFLYLSIEVWYRKSLLFCYKK